MCKEYAARINQCHASGHRGGAAAGLPARLERGQFGAAVDTGDFIGGGFDNARGAAIADQQADDIGQIIFARGIGIADPRQQRP